MRHAVVCASFGILLAGAAQAQSSGVSGRAAGHFWNEYVASRIGLGCAMGHLVGHELVHMITRSAAHGHEGIAQPTLTTLVGRNCS
jgi:hypothetical protein